MSNATDGRLVVGMRPSGKFTLYCLEKVNGRFVPVFVQDARTGTDALFDTDDAARAAKSAIEQRK